MYSGVSSDTNLEDGRDEDGIRVREAEEVCSVILGLELVDTTSHGRVLSIPLNFSIFHPQDSNTHEWHDSQRILDLLTLNAALVGFS